MKLTAFSLVIVSVGVSAGLAHAEGRVVDQTRAAPGPFVGVGASSGIQVKVVEGGFGPIAVRGEEQALARLKLEVVDGQLRIGYLPDSHLDTQSPTQVSLRMPRADNLAVSGGSKLEASVPCGDSLDLASSGGGELRLATPVRPRHLEVSASGGSRISVAGVETAEANISMSGSARVAIAGHADEVELQMSGGSGIDAGSLAVRNLQIAGSGGAEASVRTAKASGALSGGARLRVPADAQVSIAESRGSQVVHDL